MSNIVAKAPSDIEEFGKPGDSLVVSVQGYLLGEHRLGWFLAASETLQVDFSKITWDSNPSY